MQYVTADGLPPVSKIGLGTMRFGERAFDPDLAHAIIRRALALGVTHFDTAGSYGFGRSERLLGQGMLTGRYDHDHPPAGLQGLRRLTLRHAAFPPTQANLRRIDPLLEQLRALAARHDATPAAIALAWTIGPDPVVVIPGASSISQLEANAAAADITLSPEEQRALTGATKLIE